MGRFGIHKCLRKLCEFTRFASIRIFPSTLERPTLLESKPLFWHSRSINLLFLFFGMIHSFLYPPPAKDESLIISYQELILAFTLHYTLVINHSQSFNVFCRALNILRITIQFHIYVNYNFPIFLKCLIYFT